MEERPSWTHFLIDHLITGGNQFEIILTIIIGEISKTIFEIPCWLKENATSAGAL